ncbi:MAG: FAD-binding oxidoreductase [Chloroflexota bacterium]
MSKHTIAIIGGGIIGSFVAYFLARSGRAGDIAVIEADPSYQRASTPNGAGGVRQLFSRPENIQMSNFSIRFYREFAQTIAVDGEAADIDFNQRGYLFLVGAQGAKQLETNFSRQVQEGINVQLLDRTELAQHYPSLGLGDIVLGCLSPTDGTITTRLALKHLRHKVERLGVSYITARVTALETALKTSGKRVQRAILDDGNVVEADLFVNAAGAWASQISEMVDMYLPVQPMCRVKHFWTCEEEIEPLPLVKDESGLFFRPQDGGFIGGRPSFEIKPGFSFLPEHTETHQYFHGYFDRTVRPLLTTRLPAFQCAQNSQSWTGHYAQNTLDGNMILGPWLNELPNFYVACGFSGHGIMHAPAVGLALTELILDGHYSTMDLERMSYRRIIENKPYSEEGII